MLDGQVHQAFEVSRTSRNGFDGSGEQPGGVAHRDADPDIADIDAEAGTATSLGWLTLPGQCAVTCSPMACSTAASATGA